MSKLKYFLFLFLLLLMPFVVGETYKQFEDITFVEVIRLNGYPSDNILANITITDPDNALLVGYAPMTYDSVNKTFNYTLTSGNVVKTGTYSRCITATGGGINQTDCFDFEVTPSGTEQTSILENSLFLLFALIGLAFLVFGVSTSNPWLGFIGSILFILGGIYSFIYGINNEQTLYTQAISIIFVGMGTTFLFLSAYEFVWGDSEEED